MGGVKERDDVELPEVDLSKPDELSDEELERAEFLSNQVVRQTADPELSLAHYRRCAAMRITGEWMQPFVARASFNLGYMHQFGVGVAQDPAVARRFYHRCLEVDPNGPQVPVSLMIAL